MKEGTPFKSQKNRAAGMFEAGTLGALQGSGKKVDMEAAKAAIRAQRPEAKVLAEEEKRQKERQKREKAFLDYRRKWKSVTIEGKEGKLNPNIRGRVEFFDGTIKFLP